jgi:hypothetical protein
MEPKTIPRTMTTFRLLIALSRADEHPGILAAR